VSEGQREATSRVGQGDGAVGVRLRSARAADCRPIWFWRNDEETRRQSLDSSLIPYEVHERWFAQALSSDRRKLYVVLLEIPNACVIEREAVGVVRLDLDGRRGTVSIHLAPAHRGRGLGTAALRALADLAFDQLAVNELLASVKPDNHASLAAFAKAGFAIAETGAVTTLRRCRTAGDSDRRDTASASADGPPASAPAVAQGASISAPTSAESMSTSAPAVASVGGDRAQAPVP